MDTKGYHVFTRDWTMCSEVVSILGSVGKIIGRTYIIIEEERKFSL